MEKEYKYIKGVGNSGQKYLVGMTNGEVFQIKDSIFKWQWRSSDIYNKIEDGLCYDITYFGWRIGFFSTYKNIYTAKETSDPKNAEEFVWTGD